MSYIIVKGTLNTSYSGTQYQNPTDGKAKLCIRTGTNKNDVEKYGFTTDVSASEYCDMKIKISNHTCRIGRSEEKQETYTVSTTESYTYSDSVKSTTNTIYQTRSSQYDVNTTSNRASTYSTSYLTKTVQSTSNYATTINTTVNTTVQSSYYTTYTYSTQNSNPPASTKGNTLSTYSSSKTSSKTYTSASTPSSSKWHSQILTYYSSYQYTSTSRVINAGTSSIITEKSWTAEQRFLTWGVSFTSSILGYSQSTTTKEANATFTTTWTRVDSTISINNFYSTSAGTTTTGVTTNINTSSTYPIISTTGTSLLTRSSQYDTTITSSRASTSSTVYETKSVSTEYSGTRNTGKQSTSVKITNNFNI